MVSISKNKGFTLIEIVIGMLLMSLVVVGFATPFMSLVRPSTDPVFEVKASILANTIIHQLQKVGFDQNSELDGGLCRCDEKVSLSLLDDAAIEICKENKCTDVDDYGPDGDSERSTSSIDSLNDVDDFDTLKLCQNNTYLTNKNFCSKTVDAICNVSDNAACVSAQFLVEDDFKTSVALTKLGALYDSGFENFWVKIEVTPYKLAKNTTFNHTDFDITLKKINISIVLPNSEKVTFEQFRGNY